MIAQIAKETIRRIIGGTNLFTPSPLKSGKVAWTGTEQTSLEAISII